MNKPVLWVDIDDTIFMSKKRVCDVLSSITGVKYDHTIVKSWDFKELEFYDREIIDGIFDSDGFYDITYLVPKVVLYIHQLSAYYTIKFVTAGSENNLKMKKTLVEILFPQCEYVGLLVDSESCIGCKSFIEGGTFVDDSARNLIGCKADEKIVMKLDGDTEYNQCDYDAYTNWDDLYNYLIKREMV